MEALVDFLRWLTSWPSSNAPGGLVQFLILVVALLGFLGVFLGLKAGIRTHRTDAILRVSECWDSDFLRESRRRVTLAGENLSKILKEPGIDTKEDYFYLIGVGSFFEELGLLCSRRFLSYKDAYDRLGASIENYYALYKPYIEEQSETYPGIFEYFKKLQEEMSKLRKQQEKKA